MTVGCWDVLRPGLVLIRLCADLQLDGVEFSTLPSGLHLVDRDVVYVFLLGPLTLVVIHRSHTATSRKIHMRVSASFVVVVRRNTASVGSGSLLSVYYS